MNGKRFWQIVMPVKKQLSIIEERVEALEEQPNKKKRDYGLITVCLSVIILILTTALTIFAYYEIPNYPVCGYSITPTSSQRYIDGGKFTHDIEYVIKFSKLQEGKFHKLIPCESLSYNVEVQVPTDAQGFYTIFDTRGYNITSNVNSSTGTVRTINNAKVNPLILNIIYVERFIQADYSTVIRSLPPNTNESFYLFIENNNEYDIKDARMAYELTGRANLDFETTMYNSWINQSIIIYENDVPIQFIKQIQPNGIVYIYVRNLEKRDYKTYLIKKINRD